MRFTSIVLNKQESRSFLADRVRWGIIGTGEIAVTFTEGIRNSRTGTVVGIGSRTQATAEAFGATHGIPRRYGSYENLLSDPEIDAVYVATPHPIHVEWAIRAAEAGKHLLVEKPIGINHAEAVAMVDAAKRNDVFLKEAYMYRCHPQTERLVEVIRSGVIGRIRLIEASHGFRIGDAPHHRLLRQDLAGGGILDVGGYPISMVRLIAGVANGGTFAEPTELTATGFIGSASRVDEWAAATLRFPGDIVAQVWTAIQLEGKNDCRIFGDEGNIVIPAPWTQPGSSLTSKIIVKRDDEAVAEEIVITAESDPWAIEADTVSRQLAARQAVFPAMSWDDTLGNMQTMDRWREAIGLVYDSERRSAG